MKKAIVFLMLCLAGAVGFAACATDAPASETSTAEQAICGATACGGMEGEAYDDCMNFHCGGDGGGTGGGGGDGGGGGGRACTPQENWHRLPSQCHTGHTDERWEKHTWCIDQNGAMWNYQWSTVVLHVLTDDSACMGGSPFPP